jgi:predicted nucleic acid-binding protein
MKVYLDTSVISALFDARNPERQALTEAFFRQSADFEIFSSEITLAEIERTHDIVLREKMKAVLMRFPIFDVDDRTESLASEYVLHDAVPANYRGDALHIAAAVINDMDCLLSWNFDHLVKRKTKDIVKMVNTLNKLGQIEIMTPAELT